MPLGMIAGPSEGPLLPTGSIVLNYYTGSLASARSLGFTQIGPPVTDGTLPAWMHPRGTVNLT